jgi:hypothetical protein
MYSNVVNRHTEYDYAGWLVINTPHVFPGVHDAYVWHQPEPFEYQV